MNKCKYCDKGVPLIIGKTNDYGTAIQFTSCQFTADATELYGYVD